MLEGNQPRRRKVLAAEIKTSHKVQWTQCTVIFTSYTYLVRDLLIPASSARPPTSQATLSRHSSLWRTAMYMSWTLSIMLDIGLSSKEKRFKITYFRFSRTRTVAFPHSYSGVCIKLQHHSALITESNLLACLQTLGVTLFSDDPSDLLVLGFPDLIWLRSIQDT